MQADGCCDAGASGSEVGARRGRIISCREHGAVRDEPPRERERERAERERERERESRERERERERERVRRE